MATILKKLKIPTNYFFVDESGDPYFYINKISPL